MAYTKKSAGSSKAVHTAELTTGQLVLAVCTFLIVILGVFLLGIIVGEYQYNMRESRVAAAGASAPSNEPYHDVTEGEGVQPSGFPGVRETSRGERTVAARPEPFRSRDAAAPSTAVVPAPAPASAAPPAEPAPARAPEAKTEPKPEPKMEPEPSAAARAQETPTLSPLEPIEPEEVLAADADLANEHDTEPVEMLPVQASPDASSRPPAGKFYSVQVAALSEPKNAVTMKKKLETTTSWPVDIEPSASKKLQIVFVGHFATESEAERARDELRKRPEFSKAFVAARSPQVASQG